MAAIGRHIGAGVDRGAKLLEHPRLRAGYVFLLLRGAPGEIDAELGDWWTEFMEGDTDAREDLLVRKPKSGGALGSAPAPAKKRARRRGGRGKSKDGGGSGSSAEGSAGGDE